MQNYSYLNSLQRALTASTTSLALAAVIGIVTFVFTALAFYTIANRRGIRHAWLAWVPFLSCWVLGSISDQYQFITQGKVKHKRKVLLVLEIVILVLYLAFIIGLLVFMSNIFISDSFGETVVFGMLGYLAASFILFVIVIVFSVFMYIALYDVFRSCDPENAVLFLVLSILVSVVYPILLLICMNKDAGMPPRQIEIL